MFEFLKKNSHTKKENAALLEDMKKYAVILEADKIARKNAGLEDKAGSYTFTCPICGSECHGSWVEFDGDLHGGTGCRTCDFLLRV